MIIIDRAFPAPPFWPRSGQQQEKARLQEAHSRGEKFGVPAQIGQSGDEARVGQSERDIRSDDTRESSGGLPREQEASAELHHDSAPGRRGELAIAYICTAHLQHVHNILALFTLAPHSPE